MRRRPKTRACRRAVHNAERILAGRCVDEYHNYGLPPPPWAVVNDLAHCDLATMAEHATGRTKWHRMDPWEEAEVYLASVLVASAAPEAISHLQRQVLVPLELTLLDRPDANPTTPAGLVHMVIEAVGRARHGHGS